MPKKTLNNVGFYRNKPVSECLLSQSFSLTVALHCSYKNVAANISLLLFIVPLRMWKENKPAKQPVQDYRHGFLFHVA